MILFKDQLSPEGLRFAEFRLTGVSTCGGLVCPVRPGCVRARLPIASSDLNGPDLVDGGLLISRSRDIAKRSLVCHPRVPKTEADHRQQNGVCATRLILFALEVPRAGVALSMCFNGLA